MTGVFIAMENTAYDLLNLASLQSWQKETQGDNSQRISRLRRNLPLALEQELTPRQKEMVHYFYFDGMTVTEISRAMGLHKSTVSRTLKRARGKLQRCLKYSL